MDAKELLILESDIAAQLAHIDDVFVKLEERANDFNADDALEMQAESIAFQIHNAYYAIEELSRLIGGLHAVGGGRTRRPTMPSKNSLASLRPTSKIRSVMRHAGKSLYFSA